MSTKLTPALTHELQNSKPADELDVVFELEIPAAEELSGKTRGEKIALMKDAFDRCTANLEQAVQEAGGEVTGKAWINKTLRARLPAQAIEPLGNLESVTAVDATKPLTTDSAD